MKPFELVGNQVKQGDIRISRHDAQLFRDTALQGLKIHRQQVTEDSSLVMTGAYASGMLSEFSHDAGVTETGFYTKTHIDGLGRDWLSRITFAHFRESARDTKIYNTFFIEGSKGEILNAVRRVRVIRHVGGFAIDESGDLQEAVTRRVDRGFEEPMTPAHVLHTRRRVEQIMGRARVLGAVRSGQMGRNRVFNPEFAEQRNVDLNQRLWFQ